MPRIVLTDVSVTVNAIDLSQFLTSITLSTSVDVVETTGMGSAAAKTRLPGLKDNSVTLEFNQDFAAAGPEITINAVGSSLVGTSVPIVIKPASGAVSATNPSYSFTAVCSEWQNVQGSVGELSTISATWPISGAITKAVS
jgi:hypothetical protein